MFRSFHYCLVLLCLQAGFPALASTNLDLPEYSRAYDVNRNPNADGRAALKLAKETSRKILLEVGGDWCSWCHVLDRFIKDHPELEARLHETFVVLKVNVSDANDNAEFMASLPPALGYPHMYIIGDNGTVLHSQDTAEFLEKKKYSEQRFLAFLERWKSTAR
ncbi:MAG: thioredoxin family protein [Gammaproteobacteria bacterium]|nr:thioredoxin family protein [Gammaproteobacteria bacterium]